MSNKSSDVDAGPARYGLSVPAQFAGLSGLGALGAGALGWALVGDHMAVMLGLALYAGAVGVALIGLGHGFPHRTIGLCNMATLARLAMVSALSAALIAGDAPIWAVFTTALVAFAMDGLDGWLARLEARASAFGARFDMEVDSALALVLTLLAWQSGSVGAFVIILGLPRYAFWAAQFPFPWLNRELPERFSRKVVCVVQIAALILALFPLVTPPAANAFVGLAAAGLVWSFAMDVRALRRAQV